MGNFGTLHISNVWRNRTVKKNSHTWLWVTMVLGVGVIGFAVYWFKFRDDGTGGSLLS